MGQFANKKVLDRTGTEIGTVSDVIYDDKTMQPQFVTVRSGRLRPKDHVVPTDGLDDSAAEIRLPYEEAEVMSAPRTRDHTLTRQEQDAIYEHFHIEHHAA